MPWLPPNYKRTTVDALRGVEKYRRESEAPTAADHFTDCGRYCDHIGVEPPTTLPSGQPATYMNFLDWVARTFRSKKNLTFSTY